MRLHETDWTAPSLFPSLLFPIADGKWFRQNALKMTQWIILCQWLWLSRQNTSSAQPMPGWPEGLRVSAELGGWGHFTAPKLRSPLMAWGAHVRFQLGLLWDSTSSLIKCIISASYKSQNSHRGQMGSWICSFQICTCSCGYSKLTQEITFSVVLVTF